MLDWLRFWNYEHRVKGLCSTSGFTPRQEDFVREAFVAGLTPQQCASGISLAQEDDEDDEGHDLWGDLDEDINDERSIAEDEAA